MIFQNRRDAGRKLADRLERLKGEDPVVLGLARGGVVVAAPIAEALGAPLDVLVARKIGAPAQPEYGIGAVAPNGARVLDPAAVRAFDLSDEEIDRLTQRELAEVDRRLEAYRGGRSMPGLEGRTAVLVDDGLATGVTAIAAARYVRSLAPRRTVLAIPVCASQGAEALEGEVDEVVCLSRPAPFQAVGLWYEDFTQTTDEEVIAILGEAHAR
jgi:putative phosphoribosyl transferase